MNTSHLGDLIKTQNQFIFHHVLPYTLKEGLNNNLNTSDNV